MSIDFDSAALQTQHEEEEYDQEDYAREQELHKLLTDLPDDMLEDSRDSSSPELEYSTCSNKNTGNFVSNMLPGTGDNTVNLYKASYNPHHPAHQPKMFNSQAAHQGGQFDHLQREFLDSTQTADREQLAQLQILNQAHQRQIEDLERKLEDSRRNMRYLEHQFAIVKEKDGQAVSLKESGRLVEEAKEREVQMQNKVKAMEQQIQVLTERDHENMKKQRVAEAAVDSMKQQMLELCRSDTLSRAREQHDRDLTIIREQHELALLALEQKLDSASQALSEQTDVGLRLREQVKQLERQREEEQLERARVINALTQRLEESQQQCAKLLQTSVQEMSQIQIKLQQTQSAKALSENMNKGLQEDLADLKEQITLYESAVKHGVITLDLSSDWENQLSESCMDLGLKKANRKNGTLHHLSDSKLPKDEALRLLRVEMQRCLGSLKGKRQKISQLQEELQHCQSQVLEKKNKELKQSEEKVRSANSELCTKMREMIQDLDQEKQEAAESERIHQQHRDDVVNRVKTELMLERDTQVEQLTVQHQQQVQTQLSEVNDKMLAVQECYISVCKEKDMLEERIRDGEKEEALIRENERLEEARREKDRETAEVTCQTDEIEGGSVTITAEELDSRLSAQKQRLQVEADKVKRKTVEEARKQAQRELQEKHLEDMAKQVEGAVTRAYNRWTEDLTSLPEYQVCLQTEREKWERLQEKCTEQQALRKAEEQWHKKHKNQLEEQSSGAQRVEELQEEVATLQSQLEQVRREQAALLKAELAGARAVWNRDKQQEISVIQVRSERVYQTKLQDQHKKLEQALQQSREEADLQKKISEERLSRVLKETQEQHEREINKMQSLSQRKEQAHCRKECTETLSKLQKKNQELHRHLEKACRQLQHSVREHKTAMQHLKQQHLQQGLEEMKQQYLTTVEKIRDMLRYLQESRERAAEMICMEVQRERQDTARKMRRYYLTCLQELLQDGGKTTAEKKIMNAASKLAAMAKVLETEAPVRDEKRTDWSMTSSDSDTSFQVPRLSCSGRKVEPVKPFSVSAASASDLGEFGGLTPDASDLTIYNEIAQKTPRTQTLNFPSVKMSTHRQPTPGSEAEKQQGVCSRPLFSELRRRQQDSGFD
uniref:Centrosomal protein 152 n=1 Tax=Seriola lalandi dorsalis TaxID=1841481 RepID=A0A3B4X9K2_SERLL